MYNFSIQLVAFLDHFFDAVFFKFQTKQKTDIRNGQMFAQIADPNVFFFDLFWFHNFFSSLILDSTVKHCQSSLSCCNQKSAWILQNLTLHLLSSEAEIFLIHFHADFSIVWRLKIIFLVLIFFVLMMWTECIVI